MVVSQLLRCDQPSFAQLLAQNLQRGLQLLDRILFGGLGTGRVTVTPIQAHQPLQQKRRKREHRVPQVLARPNEQYLPDQTPATLVTVMQASRVIPVPQGAQSAELHNPLVEVRQNLNWHQDQ